MSELIGVKTMNEQAKEHDETKGGSFTVQRASELLKEFDIVVSEAGSPEEFIKHLCIALDALAGQLKDEEENYHEEPIPAMLSLADKNTFALASRLRRLERIKETRRALTGEMQPADIALSTMANPVARSVAKKMIGERVQQELDRRVRVEREDRELQGFIAERAAKVSLVP